VLIRCIRQDFMWGVDVMKECIDHWEEWVLRINLDYAIDEDEDLRKYMENRRRIRQHLFCLYAFIVLFLIGLFSLLTWATVKDR